MHTLRRRTRIRKGFRKVVDTSRRVRLAQCVHKTSERLGEKEGNQNTSQIKWFGSLVKRNSTSPLGLPRSITRV